MIFSVLTLNSSFGSPPTRRSGIASVFICVHPWLKSFVHQRIFHAVSQRLERGGDDIFADADRAPLTLAIARDDEHARLGSGAGSTIDDAYFVISQAQMTQPRKELREPLSQGTVQRVHRTIAFSDGVREFGFDTDLNRCLTNGTYTIAAHRNMIALHHERQLPVLQMLLDQQRERGFGRFEFKALAFKFLDA